MRQTQPQELLQIALSAKNRYFGIKPSYVLNEHSVDSHLIVDSSSSGSVLIKGLLLQQAELSMSSPPPRASRRQRKHKERQLEPGPSVQFQQLCPEELQQTRPKQTGETCFKQTQETCSEQSSETNVEQTHESILKEDQEIRREQPQEIRPEKVQVLRSQRSDDAPIEQSAITRQNQREQKKTKSIKSNVISNPALSPVSYDSHPVSFSSSWKKTFQCRKTGQSIKPQSVPEGSLMSSMTEFVHDIIPQTTSPKLAPERINWVKMQKCNNVNDQKRVVDLVIIGLARGYQIWARMENGDCKEILSERKGPIQLGLLLPAKCEPSFGIHNDRYKSSRPLFAVVDESRHVSGKKYTTVSFLSLIKAQIVHKLYFTDSVQDLATSTKIFVVSFVHHIVICDMMTLRQQRKINNTQINDGFGTPFAISDTFLAFANSKLCQEYQSCGGMESEDLFQDSSSYSIVSVARNFTKTLTSFSNSIFPFSSSQQSKELLSSVAQPGVITVVDVNKIPADSSTDDSKYADAVIAHFVAHTEPVGFIAFGNGGQLVLTSGNPRQSSTYFHLFHIYPHPGSPLLGAVRHLYTLYRGTTPAKVVDCSFSADNRWLALATNHGTTHIFGICPYGGKVTLRTHGDEIVNKESRYRRSAGLPDSDYVPIQIPSETKKEAQQYTTAQLFRGHPYISRVNIARSVENPRIGPYPSPIGMEAYVRIKQRFYSADNLSAWASDMTPSSLTAGTSPKYVSKPGHNHRLAISFSSNSIFNSNSISLLVVNNDGVLTEYLLSVSPVPYSGTSGMFSATTAPSKIYPDETLIQCTLTTAVQWILQRNKSLSDVRTPICAHNPLWTWLVPETVNEVQKEEVDDKWISQIEVLTYLAPHRRLWMGPQFSFRTYIQPSQHTSAELVTPGSDRDYERYRAGKTKSLPVTVEAAGSFGSFSAGEPTEIVEGSWSSDLDAKDIEKQRLLEKKLQEAMMDVVSDKDESHEGSDDACSENSHRSVGGSSHNSISLQFSNLEL
ncbi:unnamed protein product [Thelazia callipaeda]|uniref:BCAS3 domain-containing protein n=1 Tax=Thelazia callipaeda TaxID=103827 RepID=A0A0N5D0R1_THECL|nr:unnamed protein product [Thelazia callipaeda]